MRYLIAILVLALASLALYPLVRKDSADDSSVQEESEAPRTFTAPREGGIAPARPTEVEVKEPAVPAVDGPPADTPKAPPAKPKFARPNMFPDDPIADVVFGILRDVGTGKATEKDRETLQDRLEEVLEEENMGKVETRDAATVTTVTTILRQAKDQGAGTGPLTGFQTQAMRILASEFARDLYRRLPIGTSGKHTGTFSPSVEVALPEGYVRAQWSVLGGFEYEEGMVLPENVRALDNKKVGASGYMMTLEEVEDIHEFLLVESLWSCCFGTPPEVHQVLVVTIPAERQGIEFTTAPILVLGTLSVGEEVEDGFVTSVYRVVADRVQEVE